MRLLVAVSLLWTSVVLGSPDDFVLQLFSDSSEAKCLDGSPGGLYVRNPPVPSSSWVIHFEGGGWCTSLDDCLGRSRSDLGSSTSWPNHTLPNNDGGAHGFLSTDPSVNPRFYDWNMVRFEYCDGASFAGYKSDPVMHNDTALYFRGAAILQESIKALKDMGIDGASEIIVTGCSAGGLSVYLHLDWIRSQFDSSIRVVGVPDSGFFLDLPNWNGDQWWTPKYQTVFAMQNASFVNQDCLSANGGEQWRCFFAQYTLPHIKTPLFIINPLVDSWQMANIIQMPCLANRNFSNCSDQQLHVIDNFSQTMATLVKPVVSLPSNGGFLFSCVTHCGACNDFTWTSAQVSTSVMRGAVEQWYDSVAGSVTRLIDNQWPSNSCSFLKFLPVRLPVHLGQ